MEDEESSFELSSCDCQLLHHSNCRVNLHSSSSKVSFVFSSASTISQSQLLTLLSQSSLPHIQATVLTDDRDEETLEEEGRRDSLFEAEQNTKLGDDVIEDECRLTVVADSSVSSSRRTSGNSDTSSSTVYSEDSNTGYLRLDSSGFHSDYTDYRKRLYSHQILEEDDPGSQNLNRKYSKTSTRAVE